MLHRNAIRNLAFSTFLLTIPLNAAFAQDATAVADRIKAMAAKQGIVIAWSNVTGDAASMVMEGVTVKPASEANALPIGNITLTNVTEEDGAYTVGALTTAPFSKTEDGISVDISSFSINGLSLAAEGDTDPMAALMLYDSAELPSLSVKVADKTAFALNGLSFELTEPEDGKPLAFTGAAEKFTADLSLIEDPQSKAVIDALGYQNISGYFEMAGSWQPTDGRLTLSQNDIAIENAGTLGITFDLGGYTVDFVKSMQEMQKKMAEKPAGGDNSSEGIAMLGLMQQLTFNGASVRIDDNSLTGKVLAYVAAQQGQKPADIANQAKAILPFLLAQINNPDLAAQASAAVNAYLDDPQNIEIAAAPPAPVPFAQIMAGAMSNPMDLTKSLGVKVTANQK